MVDYRGKAFEWLKSFLANRMSFVEISHVTHKYQIKIKSKTKVIKCGVPQGSILGPVLFIYYIDGVNNEIQNKRTINVVFIVCR